MIVYIGTSLFSVLESSNLKVVVAISADLAHTHDPNGPYGYSNASQPFDNVSILSYTSFTWMHTGTPKHTQNFIRYFCVSLLT